jgi:DHA1 family chloramphenicol resistance protein-like MFS transporter
MSCNILSRLRSLKPKRLTREGIGVFLIVSGYVQIVAALHDMLAQILHIVLPEDEVGIVISSFMLAAMIGGPIFGKLTDKVGPKKMMWSLVVLPLTLVPYTFEHSEQALVLTRVISGLAFAALGASVVLVAKSLVSPDPVTQGKLTAMIRAGCFLGVGIGGSIGLWLGGYNFWSFILIADVSLACVGVVAGVLAFITWFANYVGASSIKAKVILPLVPLVIGITLLTWMPQAYVRSGYFRIMVGSSILMTAGLILLTFGENTWISLILAGFDAWG